MLIMRRIEPSQPPTVNVVDHEAHRALPASLGKKDTYLPTMVPPYHPGYMHPCTSLGTCQPLRTQ